MNEEKIYNLLEKVLETETELNKIIAMLHKNSYELFVAYRKMVKKKKCTNLDIANASVKISEIAIQVNKIMLEIIDIERELEELLSS